MQQVTAPPIGGVHLRESPGATWQSQWQEFSSTSNAFEFRAGIRMTKNVTRSGKNLRGIM